LMDANNGVIVGQGGTILRTTNGGEVTFVEEKQCTSRLNEFVLSQNHPNPFNPSTLINYSVPKKCRVTIKIYDALGREVTTLINEEKSTGNYTIKFNGSNLASGLYFYQIRTDEFVQAKSMLLLK
jgi:hypothetical protein